MRIRHLFFKTHRKQSVLILIFTALVLVGLVFTLAGCKKASPTPTITPTQRIATATPTPLPPDLPPALVETDPLPGAQLSLKNPITFYFNQPMQHTSVEASLSGEPALAGKFSWRDDATLTFTPDAALLPDTHLTINISTAAQSAKGMALLQPISLSYSTSTYLNLVQSLPANGSNNVDPTSAVVAAFNQPVVALGADPTSLPAGFTISPAANGKGEWINTSTYIFYPDTALAGGTSYQVSLNKDLVSTAGSPLEPTSSWSFSTVMPYLVSTSPLDGANSVRLDNNVQLNFSYSMDSASVEQNFSLQTSDGTSIAGKTGWNEDFTTFTFTPTQQLKRDVNYTVNLGAGAAALGGTALGSATRLSWHTVPELAITGSAPSEGGLKGNYESIFLNITSYLSTQDIENFISFTPSVSNISPWMDTDGMRLAIWAMFEPDTDYTLSVSAGLTDLWGSRINQPFTLHFRTAPYDPNVSFPYGSDTAFLTTHDKGLLAQVTNVSSLPIFVGTLTMNDLLEMFSINGYDYRQNFTPIDVENWTFYPDVPTVQATTVTIPVSPNGQPRSPGLYFMRVNVPSTYAYAN
ncbi:MAG TPA: Ig-like domain-containing protein, partial [Anaerolineales bacterium]|nr:Ig-like domain-containing protein [Anaerolineales bacterium]